MTNMTPIPRKIDHYHIVRLIGEGGMGRVLLAEDANAETQVALKHIHVNLLGTSNYHKRFEREMEIMENLSHPNLMPLLDKGEFRGLPYYVMPYIDGVSIRDYTTMYGAFMPEQALPVIEGVCSALIYMHSHSVYHRDIKPHNILIARDGTAYLTDFGIAAIENAREKLTNTIQRAGLGTDGYIAPELRGGAFASPRTDVYSLGMTIYEMFARRSLYEVLSEDVSNPLAPIPEALQPVLRRAIDQNPKFRQQTVNEFRREFRRAVKQEMGTRVPAALQQSSPPAIPSFRLPSDVQRDEPTNRTGHGTHNTGVQNTGIAAPEVSGSQRRENFIVAVMVTIVALVIVVTIYFGARSALDSDPVIAGAATETATSTLTTAAPTATATDTDTPVPTDEPVEANDLTVTFEAAFFSAITATAGVAYDEQTQQAVASSTSAAATRVARAQSTATGTPRAGTSEPTARPTSTATPTSTPEGIPFAGQELFVQQAAGLFSRVGDSVNADLPPGTRGIVMADPFGNTYFDLGTTRYVLLQTTRGTGWVRESELGAEAPPETPPQQLQQPTEAILAGNPETAPATDAPAQATGGVIGVGMVVQINLETYAVNLPGSDIGVEQLTPGMQVTILEGPRDADGATWWRIRTQVSDGWVTAAVISPVP